jgi:holo-ACP synthase
MLLQSLNIETEPSSIVCDGLRRDLLDAREQRQWEIDRFVQSGHAAVIQIATNIPGADKAPDGCDALVAWAQKQLEESLQAVTVLHSCDRAGVYSLLISSQEAIRCKQVAIDVELSRPFARLLDIDVYGALSGQIHRQALGYPARPCLLCEANATDCIRSERHDQDAVIRAAYHHLQNFTR